MNTSIKYPRTYHLSFSEGLQNDDKRMEDESCFDGKTVAVTIKMDGENTSLYRNGLHARSLDSAHHPSRSVIKQIHAGIKSLIPAGWRICGENMYAKHSIHYTNLESFFYVFSIWDANNVCLPITETIKMCEELGLTHVTWFATCAFSSFPSRETAFKWLEARYREQVGNGQEGIVIRNVKSYHYNDFQQNLAKAVRKNHIQSSIHWSKEWIPNQLKK